IVAIHDLNGDREASFTAHNGVLWLRDLLPTVITNARILSYGYDGHIWGQNRSLRTLDDLSANFITMLSDFRVHGLAEKRPLIFIAHGFGGIILKNALVYAYTTHAGHLPNYKAIESSTFGIVYLGTPHKGMVQDVTDRDRLFFGNFISISSYQTNDKVLKYPGLHSEQLEARYNSIGGKYHTIVCYAIYPAAVLSCR
ncbi:hypothetical protein BU17DRAFT_27870, partial [Hysterangium stoloniferum]